MNWGLRIVILYSAFVALILFLVIQTMKQKVDLVSDDYYQKELVYQDQIDKMNNAKELSVQPVVSADAHVVRITFPHADSAANVTGVITFYRPSDSSKDLTEKISAGTDGVQVLSSDSLEKGLYQLQMNWSVAGKNYYNEIPVYIP
ncbi:MAG TPA: FixH family protein [Bacteroidia bacterium]|nr:FixH family protein [Bacteroidia bacterium]